MSTHPVPLRVFPKMAFTDPLVVTRGVVTAVTRTAPIVTNFAKLGEGKYIASDFGSPDQPVLFGIDNRMDFSGVSTVTVRASQDKNPPTGISGADDRLAVSLMYRIPHRSFTIQEQAIIASLLCGFVLEENIARLNRGER